MTENAYAVPATDLPERYEQPAQADYFGFESTVRHTLPDKVSWVEIRVMNEGQKARYQRDSQRDMTIERGSGNARVKVDPASDRHALINTALINWNLKRGGREVPFNSQNLRDFLTLADPKIVEGIEAAIRKANPWLQGDMTPEEIDEEIDRLKELREEAVKRQLGEAGSASR